MIILGIDPGTRRIGYGIIKKEGSKFLCLAAGILPIKSKEDVPALRETKVSLTSLIRKFSPDVVSVEKIYFSKNQKTGIAVAQARGVILLAAAEKGILVKEYAPNAVKLAVTGYGHADKKAVWKMVRLSLNVPDNLIDDASDALALALVAGNDRGLF